MDSNFAERNKKNMARSINEIYQEMVTAKENNAALNGLTSSSATAIWRLLLYIVAVCANTLEKLFDTHKQDIEEQLAVKTPHTRRWYAGKAKEFQLDDAIDYSKWETDTYPEIDESKQIVKYSSASEESGTGVLTLKVAKRLNDNPAPLDEQELKQFQAYIQNIKDVGVVIRYISINGDWYACSADVFYDAQYDPTDVERDCEQAIEEYIHNLPFNSEYTNMAAVDALQAVTGVKIVGDFKAQSVAYSSNKPHPTINDLTTDINAENGERLIPYAGYFKVLEIDDVKQITFRMKPYV